MKIIQKSFSEYIPLRLTLVKKVCLLIFALFTLSSCENSVSDDYKKIGKSDHRPSYSKDEKPTIKLRADGRINGEVGRWQSANIILPDKGDIDIRVSGTISLSNPYKFVRVSSNKERNQDKIYLEQGSIVYITLIESNDKTTNRVSNYGNQYNLTYEEFRKGFEKGSIPECKENEEYKDCIGTNGKGLKILIDNREIAFFKEDHFPILENIYNDNTKLEVEKKIMEGSKDPQLKNWPKKIKTARIYSFIAPNSGELSLQIYDETGKYKDNIGEYLLGISFEDKNNIITNGIGRVTNEAKNIGAVEYIFSANEPSKSQLGRIIEEGRDSIVISENNKEKLWLRVVANNYDNNTGYYEVEISKPSVIKEKVSFFAYIDKNLTQRIKRSFQEASHKLFQGIAGDLKFQILVRGMLQLYIIVYAISFIFGLVQITQKDLVIRIFKIAVVLQVLEPANMDFFNKYFFDLFTVGTEWLVNTVAGRNNGEGSTLSILSLLDVVLELFMNLKFWAKLSAFLDVRGFQFVIGIIILIMLIYVAFSYLYIIAEAYVGYLVMIVLLFLLIGLGPLFIILILFDKTRSLFTGWINYMFNISIQPLLLFIVLIIFNGMIIELLYQLVEFEVTWQVLPQIKLNILNLPPIPLDKLSFYWYTIGSPGKTTDHSFLVQYSVIDIKALFIVLVLVLFLSLLKKVPNFINQMADHLSVGAGAGVGFLGTNNRGEPNIARSIMGDLAENLGWVGGLDKNSRARRESTRRYRELYNEVKEDLEDNKGRGANNNNKGLPVNKGNLHFDPGKLSFSKDDFFTQEQQKNAQAMKFLNPALKNALPTGKNLNAEEKTLINKAAEKKIDKLAESQLQSTINRMQEKPNSQEIGQLKSQYKDNIEKKYGKKIKDNAKKAYLIERKKLQEIKYDNKPKVENKSTSNPNFFRDFSQRRNVQELPTGNILTAREKLTINTVVNQELSNLIQHDYKKRFEYYSQVYAKNKGIDLNSARQQLEADYKKVILQESRTLVYQNYTEQISKGVTARYYESRSALQNENNRLVYEGKLHTSSDRFFNSTKLQMKVNNLPIGTNLTKEEEKAIKNVAEQNLRDIINKEYEARLNKYTQEEVNRNGLDADSFKEKYKENIYKESESFVNRKYGEEVRKSARYSYLMKRREIQIQKEKPVTGHTIHAFEHKFFNAKDLVNKRELPKGNVLNGQEMENINKAITSNLDRMVNIEYNARENNYAESYAKDKGISATSPRVKQFIEKNKDSIRKEAEECIKKEYDEKVRNSTIKIYLEQRSKLQAKKEKPVAGHTIHAFEHKFFNAKDLVNKRELPKGNVLNGQEMENINKAITSNLDRMVEIEYNARKNNYAESYAKDKGISATSPRVKQFIEKNKEPIHKQAEECIKNEYEEKVKNSTIKSYLEQRSKLQSQKEIIKENEKEMEKREGRDNPNWGDKDDDW